MAERKVTVSIVSKYVVSFGDEGSLRVVAVLLAIAGVAGCSGGSAGADAHHDAGHDAAPAYGGSSGGLGVQGIGPNGGDDATASASDDASTAPSEAGPVGGL